MTCARFEEQLALYVENDLPPVETAEVDEHLADCSACRGFLEEMRASQFLLKDLADEAIPEAALATLRARVVVSPPQGIQHRLAWLGALAAGLAAVAIASMVTMPRGCVAIPPAHPPERLAQTSAPSPMTVAPWGPSALPAPAPAPAPAMVLVSESRPHISATRRATAPIRAPHTGPGLSAADADQLARAVVAISRIESLTDGDAETPPPAPEPFVRLATSDPNVVIYWRLDPDGGS